MGEFLSYSIVSGLLMLSMYLAYKVFLARENQHGYNRKVLLAIYLISFLTIPAMFLLRNIPISGDNGSVIIVSDGLRGEMADIVTAPVWSTVLVWVFIAGMSVVAIKTFFTWIRLIRIIRYGEKIDYGSYTLVLTDDEHLAPFSWMRYMVINRRDYAEDYSTIAVHEMKHIVSHHWIDLLVAQIVCIINWFNPAAWLMRDELMLVHEYQADMAVVDGGHDVKEYQMLLIRKAVGSRFPSLANSLNHSKLKKRITMMYKKKSGEGRKLKALSLVPMFTLALCVSAVPGVRAAVSAIGSSGISLHKGSDNTSDNKISVGNFKVMNLNNNGNKTTVTINGENVGNTLTVSGGTFTTMGETYEAKSMQCDMTNGNATITVTFPFTNEYDNTSMTLNVNGEEIVFLLEDFFSNSQSIAMTKTSSLAEGMKIYIDGKEVSSSELGKLAPSEIASMTIDKQSNVIKIATVK